MIRILLLILTFLVTCDLFPQEETYPDACVLSLGGITSVPAEKPSAAYTPAVLPFSGETFVNCSYRNRYMIPELNTQAISATLPLGNGALCPAIEYYGSRLYNESTATIAYGSRLGKVFSGGIRIGIMQTHIEALWSNSWYPFGEFGFVASPVDHFFAGLQSINPWELWSNNDHSFSRGRTNIGLEYALPKNFSVLCQLQRINSGDLNLAFGTEYFLVKSLVLRLGARFPSVNAYTFGIGYYGSRLSLDLGFEQHPLLGLSSALRVSINLKRHEI